MTFGNNEASRDMSDAKLIGNNEAIRNMSDAELRSHGIGVDELYGLSRKDLLHVARQRVRFPESFGKAELVHHLLLYLYGHRRF